MLAVQEIVFALLGIVPSLVIDDRSSLAAAHCGNGSTCKKCAVLLGDFKSIGPISVACRSPGAESWPSRM